MAIHPLKLGADQQKSVAVVEDHLFDATANPINVLLDLYLANWRRPSSEYHAGQNNPR